MKVFGYDSWMLYLEDTFEVNSESYFEPMVWSVDSEIEKLQVQPHGAGWSQRMCCHIYFRREQKIVTVKYKRRIMDMFKILEDYLNNLASYGIPACEIAIYKDHNCVFRHSAGYSDYERTRPVSVDDLYNVYSNTKLMTVVATMQLIEKGKLGLEDDVAKYIPAFANPSYKTRKGVEKTDKPITIYHLLTMKAGLSYNTYPAAEEVIARISEDKVTTQDIISALAKEPLEFEPGSRWKYSRCHDVLGAVIEMVSGMRFSEYLKKYIVEPLGMQQLYFNVQDVYVKEHSSALYSYDSINKKAVPMDNKEKSQYFQCKNFESGGAGLITTTDDYALLVDALACGGVGKSGNRILSMESIEQIKTPRLDLLQQSQFIASHFKVGYGYGLGVRTLIDKGFGALSPIGEFAWDGMTGGYGLVDTDNHLAICYMQNVYGCDYAWHMVFPETRDMIYSILEIDT